MKSDEWYRVFVFLLFLLLLLQQEEEALRSRSSSFSPSISSASSFIPSPLYNNHLIHHHHAAAASEVHRGPAPFKCLPDGAETGYSSRSCLLGMSGASVWLTAASPATHRRLWVRSPGSECVTGLMEKGDVGGGGDEEGR
ncbi:hypothetical protein E2C01_062996 [Portunus trituberculatus]|uniref:Uncharacterized protein n=1 Tax=Portunus trituberculatus TaxID=210409 RepID=A0A5B7HFK0_PORTR|nr:hypothetical protein [Portunus trituberculatus]